MLTVKEILLKNNGKEDCLSFKYCVTSEAVDLDGVILDWLYNFKQKCDEDYVYVITQLGCLLQNGTIQEVYQAAPNKSLVLRAARKAVKFDNTKLHLLEERD